MSAAPVLTFWAPIVAVIALLIILAIALLYRSRGQGRFKEGSDQGEIFLSGENVPEESRRHVRSHNIYWGFFESMKRYYGPTAGAHTGIINDYLIWLLGLTALAGIVILLADLL